ncbi:hypothetical protein TNCV_1611381 [Trichonephila clavipes]|nr:hypothetical protein TNCV_1611381 [Trichonephila clavipes]
MDPVILKPCISDENDTLEMVPASPNLHTTPWTLSIFCIIKIHRLGPGLMVGFRASPPQVRDSILGLGKVESVFHPSCSGSINENQACLET